MPGHSYSIAHHNRSDIAKSIGMIAVFLAPILTKIATNLISQSSSIPPFAAIPLPSLAIFTISAGLVYASLYWFFNRFLWKWFSRVFGFPRIGGRWNVNGESLAKDGATRYSWTGELEICQKWDTIEITLKTEKSSSTSYSALLSPMENQSAVLSYCYASVPGAAHIKMHRHTGLCELVFERSGLVATGHYFTSRERGTFGTIILNKIEG
jgi:SMODS-associating 2TM, beta-strand rich effector domain